MQPEAIAVITGVKIERLRGVKEGEVQGLTGLSILVGPNGCGKSTVLDALLIAAAADGTGAAAVLRRDLRSPDKLRWLQWNDGRDGQPVVSTVASGAHGQLPGTIATTVEVGVGAGSVSRQGTLLPVGRTRPSHFSASDAAATPMGVELIDPRFTPTELHDLYSDARRAGQVDFVRDVLKQLIPGFVSMEVLTESGSPVLYINFAKRAVPVALAGEGIVALCRATLQLARAGEGGLALLEEPEVHQHPRSLRLMAQGICEAVKRGVQVVLTTHSLELIENLLFFAGETEILDQTAVHLVRLRDNVLTATKVDGETARFQIHDIGEDLR